MVSCDLLKVRTDSEEKLSSTYHSVNLGRVYEARERPKVFGRQGQHDVLESRGMTKGRQREFAHVPDLESNGLTGSLPDGAVISAPQRHPSHFILYQLTHK